MDCSSRNRELSDGLHGHLCTAGGRHMEQDLSASIDVDKIHRTSKQASRYYGPDT